MNSVQVANETWNWIKSCSVIPDDVVILHHIANLCTDWPSFVYKNAKVRLLTRLEQFKEAENRPDELKVLTTIPIKDGPSNRKL